MDSAYDINGNPLTLTGLPDMSPGNSLTFRNMGKLYSAIS